jgi:hypothetical protein
MFSDLARNAFGGLRLYAERTMANTPPPSLRLFIERSGCLATVLPQTCLTGQHPADDAASGAMT